MIFLSIDFNQVKKKKVKFSLNGILVAVKFRMNRERELVASGGETKFTSKNTSFLILYESHLLK